MSDITTERPGHGGRRKYRKPKRKPSPAPRPAPQTRRPDFGGTPVRPKVRRAPAKPYTLPKKFKTEQARHQTTPAERKAADRVAVRVKKRVDKKQAARTQAFKRRQTVAGIRRKQRSTVRDLGQLYLSNPAKYDEMRRKADQNIVEKAAEYVTKTGERATRALGRGKSHQVQPVPTISRGKLKIKKQGVSSIGGGKIGTEITDIVANAPAGAYIAGDAAAEAVKSKGKNTKKAQKLWKDYKETSAIAAAVSGDWDEAAKRAGERPVSTALELSGGKAIVGRGAGAAMRSRVAPKGFRQAASTKGRPRQQHLPKRYGKKVEVERDYSRDVINKAVQVGAEKLARRRGKDPAVSQARRVAPAMSRAHGGGRDARGVVRPELNQRVDRHVFAQSRVSQGRQARVSREVGEILQGERTTRKVRGRYTRPNAAGVQLLAEGTLRNRNPKIIRADARRRLNDLTRANQKLTDKERRRLNAAERKQLREIIALPDERLMDMVVAAEKLGQQQVAVQRRGALAGAWDEGGQAKRFFPALQSRARRPATIERQELSRKADYSERDAFVAAHPEVEDILAIPRKERAPHEQALVREYELVKARGRSELDVAARTLQRRARRGQTVPKKLAKDAVNAARARERRTAGTMKMGITEAIAKIAAGDNSFALNAMSVRRPRVGQAKGITREDFDAGLAKVRTNKRVAGRRFNEEEILNAAKVLQRRGRRGKEGLIDLSEGGPTLITQRPGPGRKGSSLTPGAPFESGKDRSGQAFVEGSREVGEDAIRRQARVAEAEVTANEGFQLLDTDYGIAAGKNGKRYASSYGEALERARELTLDEDGNPMDDGPALVPVNVAAFTTFGSRLRAKQAMGMPRDLRGRESGSMDAEGELVRQSLKDAWAAAFQEGGRAKWALMPEDVVKRVQEHLDVGTFGPAQSITNAFKDIVLTTSSPSKWIGGNITDISMRTAFAGITPMDIARGRAIVRAADHLKLTPQERLQFEQAVAAATGGGLYHTGDAMFKGFSVPGESLQKTILAAPWRAWKGGVYALEHRIEELPQWGAVGKAMRQDVQRFAVPDGQMKRDLKSLLKMHDSHIDNFAMKMATDRGFEAKIVKKTEDVIGKWGKVSPNMRRALLVAPFVQWLGAAMRYVFVTLPVHHPIKTGLGAAIMEMTAEERGKLGLSYLIPRDKQVQDYQMGSIPLSSGKDENGNPWVKGLRTGRMTSFGTATEGSVGNVGGFLFPQFAGALDATAGTSFTTEQLIYPEWWPDERLRGMPLSPDDRRKIGLGMMVESVTPFASAFRRSVLEEGDPAEPFSTILTPTRRKKWDAENDRWTENEGTRLGGILEWLTPIPVQASKDSVKVQQRLYDYGTIKSFKDNATAVKQLKTWSEKDKGSKGGLIDLGDGAAPAKKQSKKPSGLIDLSD